MATVAISGRITEIEYDDSFALVTFSDGKAGVDAQTTITPSGNPVTIVLFTNTPFVGPGSPSGFVMSSSFNVGDIVEVYASEDTIVSGFGTLNLSDENGNSLCSGANSCICRKVATGTGHTWRSVKTA